MGSNAVPSYLAADPAEPTSTVPANGFRVGVTLSCARAIRLPVASPSYSVSFTVHVTSLAGWAGASLVAGNASYLVTVRLDPSGRGTDTPALEVASTAGFPASLTPWTDTPGALIRPTPSREHPERRISAPAPSARRRGARPREGYTAPAPWPSSHRFACSHPLPYKSPACSGRLPDAGFAPHPNG